MVLGVWLEILDRIVDELWEIFQYSHEFMKFLVWSSNFLKNTMIPKNMIKFQIGP
jgi:hypothetical protein